MLYAIREIRCAVSKSRRRNLQISVLDLTLAKQSACIALYYRHTRYVRLIFRLT